MIRPSPWRCGVVARTLLTRLACPQPSSSFHASPLAAAVDKARLAELAAARWSDKDHALVFHTDDFRGAVLRATNSVKDGVARFRVLSPGRATLYARGLVLASLMSCFHKGEERVIVDFRQRQQHSTQEADAVTPAVARLYAEAVAAGEIRGFVHGSDEAAGTTDRQSDTELALDVDATHLHVSRVLYNHAKPVVSTVELRDGDVTSDVQGFYDMSEQVPTAVTTSAAVSAPKRPDASCADVTFAGGVLLQMIAGGDRAAFDAAVAALHDTAARDLRAMHDAGKTLHDVVSLIAPSVPADAVRRLPVDFFCRCSKPSFVEALARLGSATIEEMKEDAEPTVLTCQFCNESYALDDGDLTTALETAVSE